MKSNRITLAIKILILGILIFYLIQDVESKRKGGRGGGSKTGKGGSIFSGIKKVYKSKSGKSFGVKKAIAVGAGAYVGSKVIKKV